MEMILEKILQRTYAKSSISSNAGYNIAFAAFMGLLVFMGVGQWTKTAWISARVVACIILIVASMDKIQNQG